MSLITYNIDYSIVICTYNPDERLLKRCLNALYNLDTNGLTAEVILVDNNSSAPVDSFPFVREYIRKIPMKTLMIAVRGIHYARIAALSEARGKYTVYFDYNNEPAGNYLQELKKLNTKYPQVAALGPGDITVDFIDGIDPGIENYTRNAFPERHEESIKFSSVAEWQECYPCGAGLCAYTFLLKEYMNLTKQGKYIIPGLRGQEFTTGEDIQMVMYCISKGYFAGVSPTLLLKHAIPKALANNKYLQRLAYRTGICYETCLVQVFPKHADRLNDEIISESKFSILTLKKFIKARLSSDPHKLWDLVYFISLNAGVYHALRKPVPGFIKKVINYLKLE